MTEENQKPKTEIKQYELVEVPTGSALAFRNPTGNIISQEHLLVEIANKLENVIKATAQI